MIRNTTLRGIAINVFKRISALSTHLGNKLVEDYKAEEREEKHIEMVKESFAAELKRIPSSVQDDVDGSTEQSLTDGVVEEADRTQTSPLPTQSGFRARGVNVNYIMHDNEVPDVQQTQHYTVPATSAEHVSNEISELFQKLRKNLRALEPIRTKAREDNGTRTNREDNEAELLQRLRQKPRKMEPLEAKSIQKSHISNEMPKLPDVEIQDPDTRHPGTKMTLIRFNDVSRMIIFEKDEVIPRTFEEHLVPTFSSRTGGMKRKRYAPFEFEYPSDVFRPRKKRKCFHSFVSGLNAE